MRRSVVFGALLLGIGVAAVSVVRSRPSAEPSAHEISALPAQSGSAREIGDAEKRADGDRKQVDVERRLKLLEARLAEEVAERRRLETRLETVTAQLEARAGSDATENARADSNPPPDTGAPGSAAEEGLASDDNRSAMERALTTAGLDAKTAAEIKHRHDALAMSEMYLRDQATREQWLDSPRFEEEMAAIAAQQTSIRDEIGDDAFDRYLFALGETNRVRIDDVLSQSPAAQAGLQAGDMIVRYGDDRIFAPSELVAQTRNGTAGEAVRLEVIRNGARLEVEVPRGPLGLRIAATQAVPATS